MCVGVWQEVHQREKKGEKNKDVILFIDSFEAIGAESNATGSSRTKPNDAIDSTLFAL